jgi:hypothetical protein
MNAHSHPKGMDFAYLLSALSFPRETTIVRSYWTLTLVWRSKKVSGSRKECMFPDPAGTVAVLASAIDSGQTQCPSSLLLDAPSEGEGIRGASGDFDQMG